MGIPIIFKILGTIAAVLFVASFPDSKYDYRLFGSALVLAVLMLVIAGWMYL